MKQKLALISGVLVISLLLPFLSPFEFFANLDSADRHQAFENELSVRDAVYLGYGDLSENYNSNTNRLTVRDVVYGSYGIYYDKMDYEPFNNDTTFALENGFLKASFSPEVVSTDYSLLMAFQQGEPYNVTNDQDDVVMNNVPINPLSNHLSYFADMFERNNSVQAVNHVGVSNLIARIKPGLSQPPTLVYVEDGVYREDFESKIYYDDTTGEVMFNTSNNDVTFLFVENDQPVSEFVYFSDTLYNKYYQDDTSPIKVNQIAPVIFNSTTVNKDIQVKDLIFQDENMSLQLPTSYMNPTQRDAVELRADLNGNYSPNANVTGVGQSIDVQLFGGNEVEIIGEDGNMRTELEMNEVLRYSAPLVFSMPLPEKEPGEEFYLYRNYEYTADGKKLNVPEFYPVNDYDYSADNPTLSAAIYHPGNYVFVKSTSDLDIIIGANGFVYEPPVEPEDPTNPDDSNDPSDGEEPEVPVEPEEPTQSKLLIIDNDNLDTYQLSNGDIYTFDRNNVIILDEVLPQVSAGNLFQATHEGVVVSLPHALMTLPHFTGDQFNYQLTPLPESTDFNGLRLRSEVVDFKLSNSQNLYLNTFPTSESVSMTFDVNPNHIDNPAGLKYATIARNGDIYIEDISDYSQSQGTVRIEPKQTGKYVIIEEIVETNPTPNDPKDPDDDQTDEEDNQDDQTNDNQDDYEYESNAVVIEDLNLPLYQGGNGNLYTKDKNNVYVSGDVLEQLTNDETLTTTHDDEKLSVEFPNALLKDDFFKGGKHFNFNLEEKPNQAGFDEFDLKSKIYRLNIFTRGSRFKEKFPEDVTLTFDVTPSSIDNPEGLRFIRLSETGELSVNPIAAYDATSGKVTIKTDTFSFYAIAEVEVLGDVVVEDTDQDQDTSNDAPDNDTTPDGDNTTTDNNVDETSNNGDQSASTSDETDSNQNNDVTNNNDETNTDESTNSSTNNNAESTTNDSNTNSNVAGTSDENEESDNSLGTLPNTATLMYSLMAFGLLLIVSSSLLYLISSKKRNN